MKHFRKKKQHVPRPWRAEAGHGQQTQRGRGRTARGEVRWEMGPGLVWFPEKQTLRQELVAFRQ